MVVDVISDTIVRNYSYMPRNKKSFKKNQHTNKQKTLTIHD